MALFHIWAFFSLYIIADVINNCIESFNGVDLEMRKHFHTCTKKSALINKQCTPQMFFVDLTL